MTETTNRQDTDLRDATRAVAALVPGVRDEHMSGPTPCPDYPVAGLLDHLMGLSVAFTAAARKEPMPDGAESAPGGSTGDRLDRRWRDELPRRLAALADAWDDPAAWEGEATAGGVTMPAAAMGQVALDEVAVHGWDLAVATGQHVSYRDSTVQAVLAFTEESATPENEQFRSGVFGPVVDVPQDAPTFDRALGFAGRDPRWKP